MKQIFLTLGITWLLIPSMLSQAYVPFPTGNVNWNVMLVSTCDNDGPPADTVIVRYAIHGDTIINEVPYQILCTESGDSLHTVITPVGRIREADKKVYYNGTGIVGSSTDGEELLYDFTAKTGDTIRHDSDGFFYSVVLAVDSADIDGVYRKRYKVDVHGALTRIDYIIEGIGSVVNGLVGNISDIPTCGSHYWENICFREDGVVKYLNPVFDQCYTYNLGAGYDEAIAKDDFDIYPNPFGNVISIECNSNLRDLRFRLLDINGRILMTREMVPGTNHFQIEAIPGIYAAIIIDRKGKVVGFRKVVRR